MIAHDNRPWGPRLRALARWLELRAFALTPEYARPGEGLRAGLIVAAPLLVSILIGRAELAWSIFAAFWTCLADTGGRERARRRLLLLFVGAGTLTAFLGTSVAGLGTLPAVTIGPALVLVTGLLTLYRPAASTVSTLLGVVAVVAAGFPRDAHDAAVIGLLFLAGGGWAFLVLALVWRGDPSLPTRQAVAVVFMRLADMAHDIATRETNPAPGDAARQGQHRRAVRVALERAWAQLSQFDPRADTFPRRSSDMLTRADDTFHALLALDHLDSKAAPQNETLGELSHILAMAAGAQLGEQHGWREVANRAADLSRALTDLPGAVAVPLRVIIAALASTDEAPAGPDDATSTATLDPSPRGDGRGNRDAIVRTAIHSGFAVALMTLAARGLSLNYPYWATMAIVVVLQPVRRASMGRAIERIVGSVAGGVLTFALLPWLHSPWLIGGLVVAAAIATLALRSVNYTLFVAFLTVMFVLVMDILHPAGGIVAARVLDNLIGSLVAILTTIWLAQNDGPSISRLVAEAVNANRDYLEAIQSGNPEVVAAARRAAGLASNEAEIAVHAPDRLFKAGLTAEDAEGLLMARRLAGEAASLWHSRQRLP